MDIALVFEAAELLDGELMNIHYRLRDLSAWPRESDVASIRVSLRTLLLLSRGLREQAVTASHDAGSTELRAAALRARGVVVALQVSVLERAIDAMDGRGEATAITKAEFVRFSDRVLAHVGRINASWILEAKNSASASLDGILDRAEDGYAALVRDEEVAAFVARGCSERAGLVGSACRVLGAILGVALEPPKLERLAQ